VLETLMNVGVENRVGIVKLGTTWPLPRQFLLGHLKKADRILFVEEVDPFLENNIKEFCAEEAAHLGIKTFLGKASGDLPDIGEINPDIVTEAIQKILKISYQPRPLKYVQEAAAVSYAPKGNWLLCWLSPPSQLLTIHFMAMDSREGLCSGTVALSRKPAGFNQLRTVHHGIRRYHNGLANEDFDASACFNSLRGFHLLSRSHSSPYQRPV
jgi:indolepyruvate ferredoxin oxidoreductase alpha subunit